MKRVTPKVTKRYHILRSCLCFALILVLAFGKIVPLNVAKAAGEGTENSEQSEGAQTTPDPNNAKLWEPDLWSVDFNGMTDAESARKALGRNSEFADSTMSLVPDPVTNKGDSLQIDLEINTKSQRSFSAMFTSATTGISDDKLVGDIVYEYKVAKVKDKEIYGNVYLFYYGSVVIHMATDSSGKIYYYVNTNGENKGKKSFETAISETEWTTISMVISYSSTGEIEGHKLYVNNEYVDSPRGENIQAPIGMRFVKGATAGSLLIDDVRIYAGSVPHVPGTKGLEDDPSQYEADLLNVDFSNSWSEFGPQIALGEANSDTSTYVLDEEKEYLQINAGAKRLYFKIFSAINEEQGLAESGKEIVYEYMIASPDALKELNHVILFYAYPNSTYLNQFTVLNGNIAAKGSASPNNAMGGIPAGEWTKFSLVMDYSTKKTFTASKVEYEGYDYKLYINDVCVKDYGSTQIKDSEGNVILKNDGSDYTAYNGLLAPLGLCFMKGGTGTVLIDNIRVYEGTEPHIPGTIKPAGSDIYANRTFDESYRYDFEQLEVTRNSGSVTIAGTGNQYLKLAATETPAKVSYLTDKESRFMVAQAKLSLEDVTGNDGSIFTGISSDEKTFSFLNLKDGAVMLPDGTTKVADLATDKWVEAAIVVNLDTMKYTVYVDGAVHTADQAVTELTDIASIVTNISAGSLLIDNLRVYDGKELRTKWNDNDNPESMYDDNTQAKTLLGDLLAVQLNSNALYANGTKSFATKEFDLSEEGKVYLALADIKTLFGENVVLTGLSAKDGAYDVYAVAATNGYQVAYALADRLIVFGDAAVSWSADQGTEVNRYLQFDRPEADTIKDLYNQFKTANNGDVHPSLILTQSDVDRIQRLYKAGDTYMKLWGDQAIASANSALDVKDYDFIAKSNGGISDVGNGVSCIINLGVAYFLNDDPEMKAKYFEKAKAQLMNICALEDFNPSPNGSYLDTGELSFIVGLTYDWFYDEFTEDERAYIEKNLIEKAVGVHHKFFYGLYTSEEVYPGWNNVTNNWNAVCNGGQMLGAMALFDKYPDICADMIANALRSMEKVMGSYYPEGVWKEGGTYWRYALYYVAYSMQTFTKVLGDDFGFLCTPGLDQTGWYGLNLAGSTMINNFGDTSSDFINNHAVLWCATQFRDKELMAVRLAELEARGWSGGARSILHYDETLLGDTVVELPLDTLTQDMNIGGLRQKWYDENATYLGFSGTKDKSNHTHMDSGSFVVDMLGERIIVEIGADDYSKSGYFDWNSNRSYYLSIRPEGHNIYIINPTDTADDLGGFTAWATTTGTPLVSKDKGAFTSIDLSNVYAEDTNSAIRGYMITDDRRNVLVRDEIDLKWASDVYSHLFVSGDVEFDEEDPNTAILTKNGKKFRIVIDVQGDAVESYTYLAKEAKSRGNYGVTDKSTAGITKLEIYVKTSAAGKVNITMKVMAYDDPAANVALITTPIAQWSADMIPDGEVRELPALDMIYVDGEPLEGFAPDVTGYTGQLSQTAMLPVVTATSSTYNRVEIIPAPDFGEDYVIKVYDNSDDTLYRVYRVNYTRVPELKPVDGRERYPIANATESGIATNNAMNGGAAWAMDNDFDVTRWGVLGDKDTSHWMIFELEEVSAIHKIGLNQTFGGTGRKVVFTLEVSLDGQNWTTIYDGTGSGTTTALEYFIDSAEGIQAKYVRYTSPGGINKGSTVINNYSHTVNELVILGENNVTEYYEKGSEKLVEMFCSIKAGELISVTLNGETVAAENYTMANTNIGVFSLKPEYLDTLAVGTYQLALNYNDGSAENKVVNIALEILGAGASAVEIIEEGTVDSYQLGSGDTVSIHATGIKDELVGVLVDGRTVSDANYEVTEGSTIVTFKEAYLETLSVGTHKVTLLYSGNRSVETSLTVEAAKEEETTTEAEEITTEAEETTTKTEETTTEAEETTTEAKETTTEAEETTTEAEETTTEAEETTTEAEESTEADASTESGTNAAPGGDPDTGDILGAGRWLWLFMAAMVVMTGYAMVGVEKKKQK